MNLLTEKQSDRAGGWWLLQVLSGALLVLVLGLHIIAHHFIVEGGLRDYTDVLTYIANPLIFVIEMIFVVVVTSHVVLGLRSILFDLSPSEGAKKAINVVMVIVEIGTVGYGIWLALALQSLVR